MQANDHPTEDAHPQSASAKNASPSTRSKIVFFMKAMLKVRNASQRVFSEAQIQRIFADIKERLRTRPGECPIVTPLRVAPWDGGWGIIGGHHRYFASLRIPEITELPCLPINLELSEAEWVIEETADNEMHLEYKPMDRAAAIFRLMQLRPALSQADAGRLAKVKSPATTSKLLEILKFLPVDLHPLIGQGDGKIPFSSAHAFAVFLRSRGDETRVRELVDKTLQGLLTRDGAVDIIKQLRSNGKGPKKAKPIKIKLPNGTTIIIPGNITDVALSDDFLAAADANKRREKHQLPVSTLAGMLQRT